MKEFMLFKRGEITENEQPVYEMTDEDGISEGKFVVVPVDKYEDFEKQLKIDEEIISKFWLYADELDLFGGGGQKIREIISGVGAK